MEDCEVRTLCQALISRAEHLLLKDGFVVPFAAWQRTDGVLEWIGVDATSHSRDGVVESDAVLQTFEQAIAEEIIHEQIRCFGVCVDACVWACGSSDATRNALVFHIESFSGSTLRIVAPYERSIGEVSWGRHFRLVGNQIFKIR